MDQGREQARKLHLSRGVEERSLQKASRGLWYTHVPFWAWEQLPKGCSTCAERYLICPCWVPQKNSYSWTQVNSLTYTVPLSQHLQGKKAAYEFWSLLWTLMSTHNLLGMLHPMGTPSTRCLRSHSAWPVFVPSPDPLPISALMFRGAQMMSRPKSRRDYSQRSFWSLMSWNIFLSNLLF